LLHPDTELRFINERIGYGVVAARTIPRGTIMWVRDPLDQAISPAKVAAMTGMNREMVNKYGFVDPNGDTILCWDHARFVNHSCAPTLLSPGYNFEIAVRDIRRGEEVTDDYATLNLESPFTCHCGMQACRHEIRPTDTWELADEWDRIVGEAFVDVRKVDQPLWELVLEKERVTTVLERRLAPPSIRVHFRQKAPATAPRLGLTG
jgi:hypothetical protein